MKKLSILLTILLVTAFAFPGYADQPKEGGTLVFGRGGDTVGLDPAYQTDGNSAMVGDNIYECLVDHEEESTVLKPGLAGSWTISDDGLAYTFNLHQGVLFHDGTELDADAVVFSLGRMMKTPNLKWFGKGYEIPAQPRPPEYWVNMDMDNIVDMLEATGKYTVVIRLKVVNAPFLSNLGMGFASIISPTAFSKNPKEFVRNPVGTGPFKFSKWVKDDKLTLVKNEEYWDKANGGPYLDKVVFRSIPENAVRFLELKTGGVHICQFPNAADIPMAEKDKNLKLASQAGMNVLYVSFNFTKKLWQDINLRKAVAHAINRKAMVDNIYQGMGEVAKHPLPPNIWGWNKDVPDITYDPELAKEYLAKAGYPEGKGLPEISLWCMPVPRPYNPDGLKLGIAMAGDLAKVGIKAKIVSYDWGTYLHRQKQQPEDMDIFQMGNTGDNGDPDNFLGILFDGLVGPSIRTQWKNEEYHRLMVLGRETLDQAKRVEIYEKGLQIIYDEMPAVAIAHSRVIWPMSNDMMGFKLHPTGSVLLKNVWLN